MISFVGQLCTTAGLVQQRDLAGDPDPFTMTAVSYRREQPVPLPLVFDHDLSWPVGEVAYLERSRADGLLVVGRIARDDLADLLDGEWYLSAGVRCVPSGPLEFGHVRMHEVSLVRKPANVNTHPLHWAPSDIARDAGSQPHGLPLNWRSTWGRAHEAMAARIYRRAPDRLAIVDLDQLDAVDEIMTDPAAARRRVEAATAARPTPSAPDRSAEPRVRLHGEWIYGARAAEVLDRLEFGLGLPAPAR